MTMVVAGVAGKRRLCPTMQHQEVTKEDALKMDEGNGKWQVLRDTVGRWPLARETFIMCF